MALHESPMTIYFKSRGRLVLTVLQHEKLKIPKSDVHRGIVTNSVVSQVNCLYYIILCVYNSNGMIQKPHGNIFQKSGSGV